MSYVLSDLGGRETSLLNKHIYAVGLGFKYDVLDFGHVVAAVVVVRDLRVDVVEGHEGVRLF